jgi:EAL domain-containing protein (putative c-di-GMP-specific phosphodiesterase class I)
MVRAGNYDAVVSDIVMPHMDGMELMRAIHAGDVDLPVVLISGTPSIEGVVAAVNEGALRYLTKPVENDQLCHTVDLAVRRYRHVVNARQLAERTGSQAVLATPIELEASLDRAIESLFMAYQPIFAAQAQQRHGYEALVRSTESSLPHPGALLAAGERLGRLDDIGRAIRATIATAMPDLRPDEVMFVNLHAQDLDDETLYSSANPLAPWAHRIVLEITERAALTDIDAVVERVSALRRIGYRIAVDDLGAGYAGLSSLAYLVPEVVKLDISLVRGVHTHLVKQRIVRSIVDVTHDMGGVVVAEGVETEHERDAVLELGCDLLQGYLLGRPGKM